MSLQKQKHSISLLAALVILTGGLLGTAPRIYADSSWSPTLLVNTEAFQIIDDTNSSADLYLQFGGSLNKRLTYDRTLETFIFDDDLEIIGTASGMHLHAQDLLTSSGDLIVEGNSVLHGYVDIFNVTEIHSSASGRTLHAQDHLSSSGSLAVEGGIFGAGLSDCDTASTSKLLWNADDGTFSCGTDTDTDTNTHFSGTGSLQAFFDNRYVETAGDTMTGALVISPETDTTSMFVVNDADGGNPVLNVDSTNERVGIGTASPAATLQVGASNSSNLWVGSNTAGNGGSLLIDGGRLRAYYNAESYPRFELNRDIGGSALPGIGLGGGIADVDTNLYRSAANILRTNDSLLVDGNLGVGTTSAKSKLDVIGTMSGSSLTVSSLQNCDTIDTDAQGNFSCGTDAGTVGFTGTGALQAFFDNRYVETAGDTMTGALVINTETDSTAGFQVNDADGGNPVFNVDTTNERVGIGTSAPNNTLTIGNAGNIAITSSDTNARGALIWQDSTQTRKWVIGSRHALAGGQLEFNENNTDTRMVIGAGGNVGIGTTSPTTKLEVVGTASGEQLHFGRVLTGSGYVSIRNTTDSSTAFQISDADGGNPVFNVDTTNERIGIGTASPAAKLSVYGSDSATVPMRITNADAGGSFPYMSFMVGGTAAYGISDWVKAGIIESDADGGLVLGSYGNSLKMYAGSGRSSQVTLTTAGNLGIGTTSPSNKLEVVGTASGEQLHFGRVLTGSGYVSIRNTTDSSTAFQISDADGGSPVFNVDTTNERVGIGTASPGEELDVNGQIRISSTAIDSLQINRGDGNYMTIGNDGSNNMRLTAVGSTADIILKTNGSDRVLLDENGQLGIGTTSPEAKLDVVGTVSGSALTFSNPSGTNYIMGDVGIGTASPDAELEIQDSAGTAQLTLDSSNGYSTVAMKRSGNYRWEMTSDGATDDLWFREDGADVRLSIQEGGNVGIGTTSPAQLLEVAGNLRLSGSNRYIYGSSQLFLAPAGGNVAAYDGSTRMYFDVYDGATLGARIHSNGTSYLNGGNVGIGTTSPEAKLDVVGVLSGSSLTVSSLQNCDTIDTDAQGNFSCGTDDGAAGFTGTGALQAFFDNRYVETAGDTMTGALVIETESVTNSGALSIKAVEFQTGAYLTASGSPVLALNSQTTNASAAPHILFGYNNIFDTNLFRSAANTLYTDGSFWIGDTASGTHLHANALLTGSGYAIFRNINDSTTAFQISDADGGYPVLNVDTTNEYVGIGTASPSQKLDIMTTSGHIQLRLGSNGSSTTNFDIGRNTNGYLEFTGNQTNYAGYRFNASAASQGSFGAYDFRDQGSSRLFIDTAGNVGIGTTSPSGKLQVQNSSGVGSLYLTANPASNSNLIFGNTTNEQRGQVQYSNASDYMAFVTATSERVRIDSSGNVGVGTSSPSSNLHVNSDSGNATIRVEALDTYDPSVAFYESSESLAQLVYDESASDLVLRNNRSGTNSDVIFATGDAGSAVTIKGSGVVGIGTTSPETKLEVVGTISGSSLSVGSITGDLIPATDDTYNIGSDTLRWRELYLSGGSLHLGGTSDEAEIGFDTVNGAITFDPDDDGTAEMVVDDSGNVGIGTTSPQGKLQITDSSAADLRVQRTSDSTDATAEIKFKVSTNTEDNYYRTGIFAKRRSDGYADLVLATTNGNSVSASDAKLTILKDGNVGIGTTSPTTKLEVTGTASGEQLHFGRVLTGSGYVSIRNTTDSSTAFQISDADGGSPVFNVDTTNERVGIGTSSPGYKLEIAGSANAIKVPETAYMQYGDTWGAGAFYLQNGATTLATFQSSGVEFSTGVESNAGTVALPDYRFRNDTDNGLYLAGTNAIGLVTAATERIRIDSSGNVGIGTTSPGDNLHVYGGIRSEDDGGDTLFSGYNQAGNKVFDVEALGSPAYGVLNMYNNGSETVQLHSYGSSYFTGGNVGIGTTTPGVDVAGLSPVDYGHLEVAGATPYLTIDGTSNSNILLTDSNAAVDSKLMRIQYDGGDLNFAHIDDAWSSATSRLYIQDDGNVGIGTSSPAGALHVTGAGADNTPNVNGVQISAGSDGNAKIEITSAASGTPYIDFQNDVSGTDYDVRLRLTGDDSLAIEGGNVGIGTTSPGQELEVNGDILLGAATPSLYIGSDSDQYITGNAASNYLSISTANDEILRLNSNGGMAFGDDYVATTPPADGMIIEGNVGIGTTSAPATLQVGASNSSNLWVGSNIASNGSMLIDGGRLRAYYGGQSYPRFELNRDIGGSALPGIGLGGGSSDVDTNLYRSAANILRTNDSLLVDGNLGVGTTSAKSKLDVIGTMSGSALTVSNPSGTNYVLGNIGIRTKSPTDPLHIVADSGNDNIHLEEYSGGEDWQIGIDSDGDMNFEDEGTARFQLIDGGGALFGTSIGVPTGVLSVHSGTATTDAELDINATVSGDPAIQFKIASSTEFRVGVDDTDGDAFKISEGGALGTNDRLIIDPAGNVYIPTGDIDTLDGGYRDAGSCVAGTCASDKNLKENITPISGALDVIRKLRPSTFNFTDEKFGPGLQFGLIAQEVEEVLPELVEENSKGYKTVKYGMELQMLTMAAVKDLDSKVAEIEQHIDTPKNTAERGSILQVSGGSITVTSGYHKIAPEEGEDDVLAIIHGGELDGTITLQGTDATRITLRKSGKLLLTKGDFTLNGPEDTIVLMKIAEDTWVELSRSNDGSGINDLLQSMQGAFTGVDR